MGVLVHLAFTNSIAQQKTRDPYFLSDKGIEGYVIIDDQIGRGVDLIKVSLEGVLFNSIRCAEWPAPQHQDVRKLQMLLRMSDVKKRSECTEFVRSGRKLRKCLFRFHIPQCLGRNLFGEDSEYLSDLPASMSSCETITTGTGPTRVCQGESRIYYNVRADVIRREMTIATCAKAVNIIPTLQARPPICISHFGNEYTMDSTKAVRGKGKLSISKIANCRIEAISQPEPVVLKRIGEPVAVAIPLRITMEPTSSASPTSRRGQQDQLQIQQLLESSCGEEGTCNGALVSSTYISVVPRKSVPTQAEVSKMTTITKNISVHSRATSNLTTTEGWNYQSKLGCWQTTVTAKLNFDDFKKHELLVPSFDSSLIAHRYRVALKVQLQAPYSTTFVLDIPVMIRYSSESNDPPPFDDVLPIIDVNLDAGSPLPAVANSEQRFASLQIREILQEEHDDELDAQDPTLPAYHPRTVGIAAPPYVV